MRKNLAPYRNLSRVAAQSHFMSKAIHEPLGAYSPSNLLAWATNVGKYWFQKKWPFPSVLPSTIPIASDTKIAVAGDWGSGTDEAMAVAVQMLNFEPDYTIHLGDVYYVGSQQEVLENFLGVKCSQYEPLEWPVGTKGSFSLSGNHDMYSNGKAYFTQLLPILYQPTSFFRLENNDWVILGLDTGYNSTGMDLGPFKPKCALPNEIIAWLGMNPIPENKKILVLTHHQPWSAFETAYPLAAGQLSMFIHRPILWIWGHEHRMAVYDLHSEAGITAIGFCAGHGGMPVELKKPKKNATCRLIFTDTRVAPSDEGLTVGYNGHVNLQFSGPDLLLEFVDMAGSRIYSYDTTKGRTA